MPALIRSARVLGPALSLFTMAWLIVTLTRGACHEPQGLVRLSVQVRDDGGGALAEVQLHADDRALGATDAQGRWRGLLATSHARRIAVRCPEAYRAAPAQALARAEAHASLSFVCRPKLRTVALVVHAPSAHGRLLRADQQPLGRLDGQGILHAVLRRAPGSTVSLAVESSSDEGSRPAAQQLVVADRDCVVTIDLATHEH